MQEGYSEALRRSQREGLRAAEERRLARQEMLIAPDSPGPERDSPGGAGEAQEEAPAGTGRQGAAAPSKPARWTDADVIVCRTCRYWQPLDEVIPLMACCYPLIEGRLRPCRPADCYLHEGTPYRPLAPAGRHSIW